MLVPAVVLSFRLLSPPLVCEPVATATPTPAGLPSVPLPPDSALTAAYGRGMTWADFLADARARREMWLRNWERAVVPPDALALLAGLPPGFRVLAIAVDSCSDSVNTIPYIAKLVESVPGLSMRVIKPRDARALMAARRTPDGRSATPTVILLDAEGNEVGCWVERPAALQAIALEANAGGGSPRFAARKQGWYDADAGASTIREIAQALAAAAGGKRGCDAPGPSERP